jgi:hypothetical protein
VAHRVKHHSGTAGVERVDVDVVDAILAVDEVQRSALAECDEKHSVLIHRKMRVVVERGVAVALGDRNKAPHVVMG